MTALAGLVIAALLWWGLKAFSRAKPKQVSQLLRMGGGFASLAVAAVLMLRGRADMAALAGGIGAWLVGWSAVRPGWLPTGLFGSGARAEAPRLATMRTALVEMQLDEATGALSGRVIAGSYAGRDLSTLGLAELRQLRALCSAGDIEGGRLVDAYLDRRFPGWREDAERDADNRGRPDLQRGPMTEQEAYQVLGLQPGAGADEVRAAHRRLIRSLHPDGGGSTYLASRVNQAKDALLDRHR